MNRQTDINDHPSAYLVLAYDDGEGECKTEYFASDEEARAYYKANIGNYDNIYKYQMCSETPTTP